MSLHISLEKTFDFIEKQSLTLIEDELIGAHAKLISQTGKGKDFLGWMNLPQQTDTDLLKDITETAHHLRSISDCVVVIGIGGSYLGAKAVNEALNHHFASLLPTKDNPDILFAGHQMSEDYMADLMELLEHKSYSVVVISKSGTTTEPAIAFRILKAHLEEKYGKEEAKRRIVAITDEHKGALKTLSDEEGYKTYIIPDDVGGRFSVLTPVGLLPIALAGHDIHALMRGAIAMQETCKDNKHIISNPAMAYAAIRNILYRSGKKIELLVNYQPKLSFVAEWWKQLYGESEGKEHKGIFPASVSFSTDLHSMGQYIQDGERHLFETVLSVEKPNKEIKINHDDKNLDGLNFLAGKRINEVNKMAELGTMLAHLDGGVPNIHIQLSKMDEFNLGELIYFFEFACALSGYLLEVNPFDQPGVEDYKSNMFALLKKPGHEKATEAIYQRINK